MRTTPARTAGATVKAVVTAPRAMRLSARGVVKHFAGVRALNGVDLDLGAGEILGLIGPNGSGKTTLMNCVSGVIRVDAGTITVDDSDVTWRPSRIRARRGIGRTFQNLKLFAELTVWENVQVGKNAASITSRRNLPNWITTLDLDDVVDEVVRDLPYGYQRRVELARALSGNPGVLLLDEPAAGLNDEETETLRYQLESVRTELGCSIVLIDHDMNLVVGLSDRVQVLDEGMTLFNGPPDAALRNSAVIDAYLGTSL